jgi:hypothetical protein
MRSRYLAVVPVLALVAALPSRAVTPGLTFGKNVTAYSGEYGEPGLSIDGQNVYATTPGDGGAVWGVSHDGGATFEKKPTVKPPADQQRGVAPGSDSDVAVGPDGAVYVGDLTIDGIEVSRSTDHGETFPQQTFVDTNATADREWLAVDGTGDEATVYVAWHELSTGTMLVKRSTDAGKTWDLAPHTIYTQPTTAGQSAHNGTSIGQISTDHNGHVYVSYGITRLDTTSTTYGTPPISQINVSYSDDYGATWQDVTVWPGFADANYGNFWMATAVDAGGTVYAVYSGRNHDTTEPMQVYLQASKDFGRTWSDQYVVSQPGGNSLFGWVAGGGPGVAVVAWYHTDADDKNAGDIDWYTDVAQVRGLADGNPTKVTGRASDHVMHHGAICTLGIFCGVLPGSADDRSLLDFFKVTVAPDGMPAVVFSDNGDGKRDVTFVKQSAGPSALVSAVGTTNGGTTGGSTGGSSGGNQSGGPSGMPATGAETAWLGLLGIVATSAVVWRRRLAR